MKVDSKKLKPRRTTACCGGWEFLFLMIPRADTGCPEDGVALSYVASVRTMAIAVPCPFSFRFFLGSVEVRDS